MLSITIRTWLYSSVMMLPPCFLKRATVMMLPPCFLKRATVMMLPPCLLCSPEMCTDA
jgi:hypothetical protein